MSIERFRDAQSSPADGFDAAHAELKSGGKRGHWIWYIFPQLDGLGSSPQARRFALSGAEAEEFLRDPELRSRLLAITATVAAQLGAGRSVPGLMGSEIDARKLVSSLTLFRQVAAALHDRDGLDEHDAVARAASDVLEIAAAQGYPPCAYTLQRLRE